MDIYRELYQKLDEQITVSIKELQKAQRESLELLLSYLKEIESSDKNNTPG